MVTNNQKIIALTKTKDTYQATAFLAGLNKGRYKYMLDEIANSFLDGRDKYPKNLVSDYKLVTNWKGKTKTPRQHFDDGINFTNVDETLE